MSYDLAVWEGETPSDDAAASDVYETISNELESGDPVTPSASIVAYVSALLERWPDITTDAGDDSPWADGPMIANASGSWIYYFSIVWSRAEEASQYAAELAAEHGLICFDPQSETVRPTAPRSTTRRRRWPGRRR